jgi:hypothetical protein
VPHQKEHLRLQEDRGGEGRRPPQASCGRLLVLRIAVVLLDGASTTRPNPRSLLADWPEEHASEKRWERKACAAARRGVRRVESRRRQRVGFGGAEETWIEPLDPRVRVC